MSQQLHPSKIDLPDDVRAAMIGLLNARLADAVDLSTQMKQAHWNVKGPNFIALHELFDRIHGAAMAHVDEIAERITTLGGTAAGTAAVASRNSILPAYPLDVHAGSDHIDAVTTALSEFGKNVRRAIEQAGDAGDADTEDLFVEVSRDIDKQLWLVEAHAQADR